MEDTNTLTLEELSLKVTQLEQRVEKLDRLVYKLFQRLPAPGDAGGAANQ